MLRWNPWAFFPFDPLYHAPSLGNEWGDTDFKSFLNILFWINLMPQVPIIPTFLMLSPKSIQMLRYTYVSMRSEKLGNTLRNHWGNYILVNSSRERKCLIYIRCVSVCISRMYDTNIISFHTIHFHLKTSRHLNWNP